MKKAYWFLTLLTVGCNSTDTSVELPAFEGNSSLIEVWEPIRDITKEKDFSVVYSEGGGPLVERGSLTHKIFCLTDREWQKIEIKRGIDQADTLNGKIEAIEKDFTLIKNCGEEESKLFLDTLSQLGFFSLMDEQELEKKCKETGGKLSRTHDAGRVYLYAIQGDKVRILSYYDLEQKVQDCPDVVEITNVKNIMLLFKRDWFSSRNFR
jgi:hypothetical protein